MRNGRGAQVSFDGSLGKRPGPKKTKKNFEGDLVAVPSVVVSGFFQTGARMFFLRGVSKSHMLNVPVGTGTFSN